MKRSLLVVAPTETPFSFHLLPWDLCYHILSMNFDAETSSSQLEILTRFSLIELYCHRVVHDYLENDAHLLPLLPPALEKSTSYFVLSRDFEGQIKTFKLAASKRLYYDLLDGASWNKAFLDDQYSESRVSSEVKSLVEKADHEIFSATRAELEATDAYLLFAYFVKLYTVYQTADKRQYAFIRNSANTSVAGQLFIHEKDAKTKLGAFVREKGSKKKIFLENLRPLLEGKKWKGERCYELQANKKCMKGAVHLMHGEEMLAQLKTNFASLYPVVSSLKRAYTDLNIKKEPIQGKISKAKRRDERQREKADLTKRSVK